MSMFKTTVIVLVLFFIVDYVLLPAWNFRNPFFIILIAIALTVWTVIYQFISRKLVSWSKYSYSGSILLVVLTIVLGFLSSEMLNASRYQKQINITNSTSFDSSFESIALSKIPVVDKQTAIRLGENKLVQSNH
jgi:hypothetical protein